MSDPNQIVPKLLAMKEKDLVGRLASVMSELRIIEAKQTELVAEQAAIDHQDQDFARLSLQNGYARYLQARRETLATQKAALQSEAEALQKALKETIVSQSVLSDMSQA